MYKKPQLSLEPKVFAAALIEKVVVRFTFGLVSIF